MASTPPRALRKMRHNNTAPSFTGNCPVRQHTADGVYVGRCDHSTYDGACHLHGDVTPWLADGADLTAADDRLIDRPARKEQS